MRLRPPIAFLCAMIAAIGAASRLPRLAREPALPAPCYDEVFGKATHNSYWTAAHPHEFPWPLVPVTGTRERLIDQLLFDGARAIELDVHRDDAPHSWAIYHTDDPANSQCRTLAECLRRLQLFHYALPRHEPLNVIIELKETWPTFPRPSAHVFDAAHTIEDFDAIFRRFLPGALFEPADLFARAPGARTLAEAAERAGWPTIEELRGKFIVNVLGNWSNNATDWAIYATAAGGVARRAGFPMRSVFRKDGSDIETGAGSLRDPLPPEVVAEARAASVFWQVETLDCPEVPPFLAHHGVIRCMSTFEKEAQRDRVGRGFQLVQTDYPWNFFAEGARDPRRRVFDQRAAAPPVFEPGGRLLFAGPAGAFRFFEVEPAGGASLSAVVSGPTSSDEPAYPSPAPPEGAAGAVRAESADGAEWIEVGRALDRAATTVALVYVEGRSLASGRPERISASFPTSPCDAGPWGDVVRLEVAGARPGGGARVAAFSAGQIARDELGGEPAWAPLGSFAFARPMRRLGLASTRGSVLFVRPRRGAREIGLGDLPLARGEGAVVDLTTPRAPDAAPLAR
jgi:hypothetical protein